MKWYKLYNKYDKFLFILIASLAFGIIGGALQVVRVLGVLLVPFLLGKIGSLGNDDRRLIKIVFFFINFCAISLIWTPDSDQGLKELVYFVIHFLVFFEIICFSKYANKPLYSISAGWVVAVGATLLVAAWEIRTGNHLSVAKVADAKQMNTGVEILLRYFVSATFYNLNTYVTFLCFAAPFSFFQLSVQSKLIYKIIIASIIVFTFFCILYNASRGGLLSVIVMSSVYLLMNMKSNKSKIFVYIPLLLIIIYVIMLYGEELFMVLAIRSSNGMLLEGGDRWVIWGNAIQIFLQTFGVGVGIGGMGGAMLKYGHGTNITITHNMFLEILLQYGIVFFVFFIVFLIKMFLNAKRKDNKIKTIIYMALISFPIYTIINSGYLQNPFVFIALASLYVFSKNEYIKSSNTSLRLSI